MFLGIQIPSFFAGLRDTETAYKTGFERFLIFKHGQGWTPRNVAMPVHLHMHFIQRSLVGFIWQEVYIRGTHYEKNSGIFQDQAFLAFLGKKNDPPKSLANSEKF